MKRAASILIRAYQLVISPVLPPACRFHPTCSEYAREAVERWGFWRGTILSLKRLARCHPFGGHGFDPVPEDQGLGIRDWGLGRTTSANVPGKGER